MVRTSVALAEHIEPSPSSQAAQVRADNAIKSHGGQLECTSGGKKKPCKRTNHNLRVSDRTVRNVGFLVTKVKVMILFSTRR